MHLMATRNPIFYDIEASNLDDGFPIEIGWAWFDSQTGTIKSEGYLILPSPDWDVRGTWDDRSEELHGISFAALNKEGRRPYEIAGHMNKTLAGCELFSDSPFDENWLQQIFHRSTHRPRRADQAVRRGSRSIRSSRAPGEFSISANSPRRSRCPAFGDNLDDNF